MFLRGACLKTRGRFGVFTQPRPKAASHTTVAERLLSAKANSQVLWSERLLLSPAPVWWTPLNLRDNA